VSGDPDAVASAMNERLAVPASLMTFLAARSISWQLTPGRTASTPACCARRTTSWTSLSSEAGSSTQTVRVVSDA
jgi:hypothetical protein